MINERSSAERTPFLARQPKLKVYFFAYMLPLLILAKSGLAGAQSFTHGFTSFSLPITGATDFATGFQTCLDPNSQEYIGPIGVLFDGTHFFATDVCNGYTYRFTAAGGSVSAPDAQAQNLLTD